MVKTEVTVHSDGTHIIVTRGSGDGYITTWVHSGKVIRHSSWASPSSGIDELFVDTSPLLLPPESHTDAVKVALRDTSRHYCAGHLVPDWLYQTITRHLTSGANAPKITAIMALRGYFGEDGREVSLKEAKQYVDALAARL